MGEEELRQLIGGCIRQDRASQKMLYKTFYGFSMGICLRYANNREEAAEVMNQGFFKVFTRIGSYDPSRPFKAWLGRVMINVSIDYYRSNIKTAFQEDLDKADEISNHELPDRKLHYDDLIAMVHKLPNAYRTVFNLYAIEGYTHEEIGEMLGISSGTSKSNLHKARHKLKQMILETETPINNGNYSRGIDFSPSVAINKIDTLGDLFRKNI
jgi:RNA polymerase sigma-70 factor (ECF subfamily)